MNKTHKKISVIIIFSYYCSQRPIMEFQYIFSITVSPTMNIIKGTWWNIFGFFNSVLVMHMNKSNWKILFVLSNGAKKSYSVFQYFDNFSLFNFNVNIINFSNLFFMVFFGREEGVVLIFEILFVFYDFSYNEIYFLNILYFFLFKCLFPQPIRKDLHSKNTRKFSFTFGNDKLIYFLVIEKNKLEIINLNI